MIYRFLVKLSKADTPGLIWILEYLKRFPVSRWVGRKAFQVAQEISIAMHQAPEWKDRKFRAILKARMLGGSVTVDELEHIWTLRRHLRRVLVIADGPEADQIGIMLGTTPRPYPVTSSTKTRVMPVRSDRFPIIVAVPTPANMELITAFQHGSAAPSRLIRVGQSGNRSRYCRRPASINHSHSLSDTNLTLNRKLANGDRLRIVLLNDVGFQYGAGMALKRQAASFLLLGWDIAVVARRLGRVTTRPVITGVGQCDGWFGAYSAGDNPGEGAAKDERNIIDIVTKVRALEPDIVVTGNIHGAGWPIDLLLRLRAAGVSVVAYMHDAHLVTGRCAHPLTCLKFQSGCDATCPTANEYPRLDRGKIANAWQRRKDAFTGPHAIPLIANSHWTHDLVRQRFGTAAKTDVVHLGLDHELFAPMPKATIRRLLNLPNDKPIIALGAVDIHDQWKGGEHFHQLHRALTQRNDVSVVVFGRSSEHLPSTKSFGIIRDERLMPFVMNCADLFVSTATAESFGQTVLEASSCALPVVAFGVGGVKDIVLHEQTGLLVDELSTTGIMRAIDWFIQNPSACRAFGENGRARIKQYFTLDYQANAWLACLMRLYSSGQCSSAGMDSRFMR
jgi:glycosyltransferase involved in cell wall biosynthesis